MTLIYVPNIGWFDWDGSRWSSESGPREARKDAFRVARAIKNEAKALDERPGKLSGAALRERVGRLYAWAGQSGNVARIAAMLDAAAIYLSRDVEELDTEPFLLAAPNGTIRLGTHCDLLPSNRANLMTHCINVPYTVGAECPLFERFLIRIIPDEALRDFLQRICGYVLTGSTREHKLILFYGTGRNGKSTLVNVLRKVMGDYAMGSPVTTFLAKRDGGSGGEPSPDLARISHRKGCIGAWTLRKLYCENDLLRPKEFPDADGV
jgi:putative DNA primase/helicase